MEVPAISDGVLSEIRIPAGEVAAVGAVVAVIVGGAGALASGQSAVASAQKSNSPVPASQVKAPAATAATSIALQPQPSARSAPLDPFREVRTPERNYGPARLPTGSVVTPLARRLASESGIDLSRVKGSGPRGRIIARDIEAARASTAQPQPIAAGLTANQVKAIYADVPHEEIALDNMRRTIAARLLQAKQTVPHFYLTADVEIDQLVKLREEANASAPKDKEGLPAFKLSLNDFVIKALALALQRVPAANAVWAEDRILRFTHSDIGVAVAIDGGLLTPVIRKLETKSISSISTEMKDLADRARARRLAPSEYQGGSTAISNLGMYGVREFAAIINPPHATILAVGAVQRRPAETGDGGVRFVSQMTVTLSCDHRVVDGALGAELLAAFKGFIERPVTMLV
jgi:pyruvate dehydrogenase E2 component (dihydrolipoamide acetyltransferase)